MKGSRLAAGVRHSVLCTQLQLTNPISNRIDQRLGYVPAAEILTYRFSSPSGHHGGMSISVELERVQAEAAQRGPGAFLLTVTDDGRPHVVAVTVGWEAETLVMDAGRSSTRNAGGRPGVTLLWPPAEAGGYSLIVDGEATAEPNAAGDGGRVSVEATRAVLHRPATGERAESTTGDATACTADCVPLLTARPPGSAG